jgi:hypothetical protein
VEEQQVEVEIVLADAHALLPGDEGEAAAQLQQHALDLAQDGALEVAFAVGALEPEQVEQVGIAKDDVGAHLPVAKSVDLGRDDLLRLLRQRGALEQHAADLLPQRAHVPTLDAAHLGVEVAGQRVLDRQQLDEVAPAQLCRQRRHNLLRSGNPDRTEWRDRASGG